MHPSLNRRLVGCFSYCFILADCFRIEPHYKVDISNWTIAEIYGIIMSNHKIGMRAVLDKFEFCVARAFRTHSHHARERFRQRSHMRLRLLPAITLANFDYDGKSAITEVHGSRFY